MDLTYCGGGTCSASTSADVDPLGRAATRWISPGVPPIFLSPPTR
jgi:hypothetical protein